MRLTVNIPDSLGEQARTVAANEKISVSSLTAAALEFYLVNKRRQKLGSKVLQFVDKEAVAEDALEELERGRGVDRASS